MTWSLQLRRTVKPSGGYAAPWPVCRLFARYSHADCADHPWNFSLERDAELEESIVNYDLVVSGIKERSEEQNLRIAEAQKRAAFAKKEIEEGFPLLCAHSLVGLWGAFEAAVDDFLATWLEAHPSKLTDAESIRLRVSASDLLVPIEQDRIRLVLAELARSLSVEAG
jgi:hypothetical protein